MQCIQGKQLGSGLLLDQPLGGGQFMILAAVATGMSVASALTISNCAPAPAAKRRRSGY